MASRVARVIVYLMHMIVDSLVCFWSRSCKIARQSRGTLFTLASERIPERNNVARDEGFGVKNRVALDQIR